MNKFDTETETILTRYGFDQIPFDLLKQQLQKEGFNSDAAVTRGNISHPPKEVLKVYPERNSERWQDFYKIGQDAIESGEIGVVILNGGMATRFGGVPKGVVPVVNNRSFLDYKISQVVLAGKGKAKLFLMNSFATHDATVEHLKSLNLNIDVGSFSQYVSLRLTEKGEPFLLENGKPSLYAPGHGDFLYAINSSGELEKFIAGGGKYITLSNVDNLGAGLDPVIIGMHIKNNKPMSVELVDAYKGDAGGFPAIVNGNLAIMEAFRLPADFDVESISVFNTNTFVFNAQMLLNPVDLDWFAVKKKVNGRDAVQFERLVGQLTEFVDVSWLVVKREGPDSRFIPIKMVSDIQEKQESLQAILKNQGIL
jgi:UTP--glucose-1-phosphate uridylyltransferase